MHARSHVHRNEPPLGLIITWVRFIVRSVAGVAVVGYGGVSSPYCAPTVVLCRFVNILMLVNFKFALNREPLEAQTPSKYHEVGVGTPLSTRSF